MKKEISREQFNIAYRTYARELFVISYGYTKNSHESEDILQEVFLAYLRCNKSFKTLDEEKYWLIRVTINKSINYTKSYYRKNVINDENIVGNKRETNDKDFESELMLDCMAQLQKKHREILILYYFDDLAVADVAKILKISQSAVKARLMRARNHLKKKMEEENEG